MKSKITSGVWRLLKLLDFRLYNEIFTIQIWPRMGYINVAK